MSESSPNPGLSALEERIATIEALGDEELGRFTRLDWWLCTVGAVVIPAILLWWFAG
jgi:hypothetical protein